MNFYPNVPEDLATLSAGTETIICLTDCNITGSTAAYPPHPTWTNGYGKEIVMMDMVLIGSGNGLNG